MTTSEQRRKGWSIALGVGGLVLFLAIASLNAFNWKFMNPATIGQTVIFTALSLVVFVLFVVVLLMLGRNLLKLFADQRSNVMGSRLRTRMMIGAILVSLVPLVFMYTFAYGLMNRAVERWFTQPVTQIRDDSNRMALELSQYTTANARVEAESIASNLPSLAVAHDRRDLPNRPAVQRLLRQHQITLQGGFAVVYRDGVAVAALNMPQQVGPATGVKPSLAEPVAGGDAAASADQPEEYIDPADPADAAVLAAAQRGDNPVFTLQGEDFALGTSSLSQAGARHAATVGIVVVGLPLPHGMASTMARLRVETDNYWALARQRSAIRRTYMILLLMMTSLALFVSVWLALYLSKQVTKPVEALADAMALIAGGDYGHRVGENATGELGDLVRSFNHMAEDLEGSRAQVQHSTDLLSAAKATVEARRAELETMLETIPNGVATVDAEGRIVLANRALSEMLDPGGRQPFIGSRLPDVFPGDILDSIDGLMQRSHRMGSASAEMEMELDGAGTLNLLVTVARLERAAGANSAREHLGYVVVLENATELLRAQKQSAWKEVARRVAHEIKNPLTPISLSAEQIGRHIERLDSTLSSGSLSSPSVAVIRRCAEVISTSVETMRGLVDQFASLAQFPTAQPRPADLNTVVENSLALFAGRTEGVRLIRRMDSALPLVLLDAEAMKRALGNLIDNAVEAMSGSLLRELRIVTTLLENGMVELTVADTGAGLTDDMRERLFLPYFSTKQRGTGLGLAIAAKIIQEHGGTIRAEKNEPAGAKFIVELRPAGVSGGELDSQKPEERIGAMASQL
jgi:two-component system nitrogen regulation sensor histidine kinase NtrY